MKKMGMVICAVFAALATMIMVILPPSFGKIPQFKDENGEVLENSIAEKTTIEMDGYRIGLTILGEDINNPVLIVCGGGPGIPQYLLEYLKPSVLPKEFVVCYFDYIGCGTSYVKVDPEDITNELYFEETLEVTNYLKERFNKEKIYIMGHSYGSYVALNMASMYPENYIAYLAVSQTCDQNKSEFLAYDYMKEQYEAMNNHKMVKMLEKYNIRNSEVDFYRYKTSGVRDKAMHALGVGSFRDMKSVITGLFFPSLRCRAYTIGERINIWKGKAQSNRFPAGVRDFNAFASVQHLDIPVYFFGGEYDYTCFVSLQQAYYDYVDAPKKEFYLYDNEAHSPIYENPDRTLEILEDILSPDIVKVMK